MSAARPLLLLLLLAAVAKGQWVACPDGSCCPVVVQPQQQRQPQQSQQPIYRPRPLVPVKPIPQAEAQPEPATPKPEQPDWKAWEKSIQERLDKQAEETQEANAKLVSQIAAVKPCGCDNTAIIARLTAIEVKLNQPPPVVQPPQPETHVVVVADRNAPYWPRLAETVEKTKQTYHGVQTAPLPAFPIGEHPQAVIYEDNVPVRVARGQYAVEALLSRLSRGEPI